MQLPPVTLSCSHEHSAWPGTTSISAATLFSVVNDVADSVTRSGLSALVLVNAHGGNYVLSNIVQEANAKGTRMALFPSAQDWKDARAAAQLESSMHEDMHAGEIETSILLHSHPELVKDGYQTADWVADDRRYLLTEGLSAAPCQIRRSVCRELTRRRQYLVPEQTLESSANKRGRS
jgi:creatinine amidohydrolase